MANYQYTSDLIADALFRAGEPIDGSSDYAEVALDYANRGYFGLIGGGGEIDPSVNEKWWWLRASSSLTMQAPISTGTVEVTQDSTAITFSDAPAVSVAGWHFRVSGILPVYKIAAHTAGATTATLDSVYTDTTDSAAVYKLMKLEYSLAADLGELISPMRTPVSNEDGYRITGVDTLDAMLSNFPLQSVQQGAPSRFAITGDSTVQFNRYYSGLLRIEYDYSLIPDPLANTAAEEPVIPQRFRKILADVMTYFILLDKNDNRADSALLAAKAVLASMKRIQQARMARLGSTGKIFPRRGNRSRRLPPLRTESGIIIG
jgi:hypothetical protein